MKTTLLLVLFCLASTSQISNAALIGIDTVDGPNSLYATDWGHTYNTGTGNEFNAIGRGAPARAFEVSSLAYGFTSGDRLNISASDCIVDLGSECTEPGYLGGEYRGLPVYSLIGLWSTSAAEIVALDTTSVNPAFLIGDLLNLVVPDFTSALYLFMATNDGDFSDNSGAYSVRIDKIDPLSRATAHVPVPPVLYLILFGLLLIRYLPTKRKV
jgi:hypothetical protein